ncbi:aconitase family protein, partial [Chloroflexota bacterium]
MTIAEKILARNSGLTEVKPGQYVTAKIDMLMAGDHMRDMYEPFKRFGIDKVWDPAKVIALTDHRLPAKDIITAEQDVLKRKFVEDYGLPYWYDVGRGGICHQIMPEKGHILPGTLVLGMDSHSTTYGAFNAASTGIQYPESFWVAAKGELWFRVPETIRFEISGELPPRIMGKDVMLKIAGDYGTDVALYKSAEFVGTAVEKMSLSN